MKSGLLFSVCVLLGCAAAACGWLVPAHLRAVDADVLQWAGRNTPSVAGLGQQMVNRGNLGAARLLAQTARQENLPGAEQLNAATGKLATLLPATQTWGGGDSRLVGLFETSGEPLRSNSEPFTEFAVRRENRAKIFELLGASPGPAVLELLHCRDLTNTVLLPPSASASGQAFDSAICVCGLLLREGKLTTTLSNTVDQLAADANRGRGSQPLEEALMDFMSLGQRFNWAQLAAFAGRIEDAGTLHQLAGILRQADDRTAPVFSAVLLSGEPRAVAGYLLKFDQTGLGDLTAALRFGEGGVDELLHRDQRLYSTGAGQRLAARAPLSAFFNFAVDYCWRRPGFALILKWLLYLAGGFLLAAALHFARPVPTSLEQPLQVRGFHFAREFLFALGFLLVMLLLSEPFLAQESQKVELPFRLRLPMAGAAALAEKTGPTGSIMNLNPTVLITMLIFFVLQALLYIASIVKLAEIRRQAVPPRIKLKLLENEDHLFDAGLYLGFLGTIVSFILVSLTIFKQLSLMSAYSSTSFGILFVVTFKIFHLRPARRTLLLEAEADAPDQVALAAMPGYVTPS
jgi:hypothetical protein